ncbi:MAG TPA: hypothetical protein VHD36_18560 [Pirellulales bacterium]|nr:hypothetical protein [Pirellulales bacterium]
MHKFSKWILGLVAVVVVSGALLAIDRGNSRATAAPPPPVGDHWQNFDGHWSYWHEGDKRWYYTDGTHWYYHNGTSWVVYQFDKLFGLNGFHHGDYHPPGPGVKVVVPTHSVWHR